MGCLPWQGILCPPHSAILESSALPGQDHQPSLGPQLAFSPLTALQAGVRGWAECPCHEYQIRSPTCAARQLCQRGAKLQQSARTHNSFADASKSYPGSGCSSAHSTHCVLLEGPRQLFGGWLAVSLEYFFLPLSNSAMRGQADPNQQQHGLPQCQGGCKGAVVEAVWGRQARAWESWKPESRERTCSNQQFIGSRVSPQCTPPAQQDCDPHRGSSPGCCVCRCS